MFDLKLNTFSDETAVFNESSLEAMFLEESSIEQELACVKQDINGLNNLLNFCKMIHQYGGYPGFEEFVADCKQLNAILGVDVCTVSVEQLEDMYSNEILRDSINKFLAKINTALGRVSDRISNFIKTVLPFKEKYLKEMTELKQILTGKKINEEKFKEQKIDSALNKKKFEEWYARKQKCLTAILDVLKKSDSENIEKFFQAADDVPETIRTSFGTFFNQPWKSWFTTAKIDSLGWSGKDVLGVLDKGIASIMSIQELHTGYAKWHEQLDRLESQISTDRATGKIDEAIAKREQAANACEFLFQVCEAAEIYQTMIRREMYFATYLGRAAKRCME